MISDNAMSFSSDSLILTPAQATLPDLPDDNALFCGMCVPGQPAASFELLTQPHVDVADSSLDTLARVAIYSTAPSPAFAQRHGDLINANF
jgi:hypothetical protein